MNTAAQDLWQFEEAVYRQGYRCVAGIDEAGRGPLAGPVVAAAVVLPRGARLPGVQDSKRLSASQREKCCLLIEECASEIAVGLVEPSEIDRINILRATFQAMIRALSKLRTIPDYVLIDGPYTLPVSTAQQGIPGGDRLSISIAAASIVAKVHRDRLMQEYHRLYPSYGFDKHKGYGTPQHLAALRREGPCPIHRMSFRGVIC